MENDIRAVCWGMKGCYDDGNYILDSSRGCLYRMVVEKGLLRFFH